MKPINFKESNVVLHKPANMSDGECGILNVWSNDQECISCWEPTWKERLSILLFGRVWLSVYGGRTQPPVSLWAAKTGFSTLL